MQIGQASKATGVSAKMIRHYESIGLVRAANRTGANYREYDSRAVNEIRFIKRARDLGFSLAEIQRLLSLWRDRSRPSREVKRVALEHVNELDRKVAEMKAMADTLRHLAHCCQGDDRPDCPILDDLTDGPKGPIKGAQTRTRRTKNNKSGLYGPQIDTP